eukprot:CAMPEP_0182445054 /NCGR_PEP_ID=MMETSP1172-20130603/3312_1 /TAXON_ID=708627 /ORGANISM="Timspurckia oligopyrenoides, Strain CCMP3278" /LENGTH=306 /DNA_ID=CAMNT_0024640751 /DNA_START=312 /DNA_END=1232 /DNA_ORIENTATION=-
MPIGIGLTKEFWNLWIKSYFELESQSSLITTHIFTPSLLGTDYGYYSDSYQLSSDDWSYQLSDLITRIIPSFYSIDESIQSQVKSIPIYLVSQGGLCSVSLQTASLLTHQLKSPSLIILSPPPRSFLVKSRPKWITILLWKFFCSEIGTFLYQNLFQKSDFIENFSKTNLFSSNISTQSLIFTNWIQSLSNHAQNYPESRFAAFSVLSGSVEFNTIEYINTIRSKWNIQVIIGDAFTSVKTPVLSSYTQSDTQQDRLSFLQDELHIQENQIHTISNAKSLLPYENAQECARIIREFIVESVLLGKL